MRGILATYHKKPAPSGRPTITSFSYDNKTGSIPQGTYGDINAIAFSVDGIKLYTAGEDQNKIYQFSLGTARDVSTITYDNKNKATGLNVTSDLEFKDDGQTLYVGGGWGAGYIYKYTLSTARDISTATYVGDATGKSNISFSDTTSFKIYDDGNYVFTVSRGNGYVYRYEMSTVRDITSIINSPQSFQLPTIQSNYYHEVVLNPQGTQMFILDRQNHKILIYGLPTPFDLTSIASAPTEYTFTSPNDTNVTGMIISSDGEKMYLGGWLQNNVYQYSTVHN